MNSQPRQIAAISCCRLRLAFWARWISILLTHAALLVPLAAAGEPQNDLTELNLEDLRKVQVSSASMYLQSDREAPSSVTVITADQIRKFGYRTLADNVPNLPLVSLLLAPGVTGTHSTDRGDSFSPPNVLEALISGDDRQWIESTGTQTVYLNYHDVATFNIEVQRSSDGGATYNNGFGEAIDPQNLLATAGIGTQTGNTRS